MVSPEVRSAERTSPIGSAVSAVSAEDGRFVSVDSGRDGKLRSGGDFSEAGVGLASVAGDTGGRQEVRHRKRRQ